MFKTILTSAALIFVAALTNAQDSTNIIKKYDLQLKSDIQFNQQQGLKKWVQR